MLKRASKSKRKRRESLDRSLPSMQWGVRDVARLEAYAKTHAYQAAELPRVRRKRHMWKVAVGVLSAVLLAVIGCGTAFALYVNQINDQLMHGGKSDEELLDITDALGGASPAPAGEPFYMMLIGSDRREDDISMGARSDTNVVVRVDAKEAKLTMVSIPRDTKIEIEGYGTQKFNAAYAFGGAAGAIEAAEELLDVDITHYAEVNFRELAALVDAVGGVTVEVESTIDDFHCDDGDGNHYVIEEGTRTLSGGEALTFARSRQYADGDFTRQSHQRQLIEAIIEKVLALPISSMPGVIQAGAACVTTDLGLMDIVGLAQQFATADGITIYSAMLPSYTQNINGISFVINDEEMTKEMMETVERGEDPSGIVSDKTAGDYADSDVDTSNVLLFSDDDEVVSGGMSTYVPQDTPYYGTDPNASDAGAYGNQGGGATGDQTSSGGNAGYQGSQGDGADMSAPQAPMDEGAYAYGGDAQ